MCVCVCVCEVKHLRLLSTGIYRHISAQVIQHTHTHGRARAHTHTHTPAIAEYIHRHAAGETGSLVNGA